MTRDLDASGTPTKRDWCDREFRRLVTLGESTTAGGWSTVRDRCWVNVLAALINDFQRTPVELINVGTDIPISLISPDFLPSTQFIPEAVQNGRYTVDFIVPNQIFSDGFEP